LADRCGSSRFQNGSSGGEDASRIVVGDFLFGFQPVLDIATAELRPFETQRFATDEGDGFRFHLAEMDGRVFVVHEFFGSGVPKNDVGDFVKCGFVRERRKGIYSNFMLPRKTLNVAVYFVKRCARNTQSAECRIKVETGNRCNVGFFAFGLCEYKPVRPKPEGNACLRLCWFFLRAVGVRSPLERHGHTEGDSSLPLMDLPFLFEPAAIGVERSGLQVPSNALFEREQGIPEAVVMKCGVGFEHPARLFDRIAKEFPPSGMLSFWHFGFPLFFRFSSMDLA